MPIGSVRLIAEAMPLMRVKSPIGRMLENEDGRPLDLKTKVVIYSIAKREYTKSLCWYVERSDKAASDYDSEFDAAIRTILDDPQRFPFFDDHHQF